MTPQTVHKRKGETSLRPREHNRRTHPKPSKREKETSPRPRPKNDKLSIPKTQQFRKCGNAAIRNCNSKNRNDFSISANLGTFDLFLMFQRPKNIAIWNLRFRKAAICDFIPRFSAIFCRIHTCGESCDFQCAIWKRSDLLLRFFGTLR